MQKKIQNYLDLCLKIQYHKYNVALEVRKNE